MGKPVEIDVIFVGQTGVGKSSLINMIMGIRDESDGAAGVSNDARPCTTSTVSYSVSLEGFPCRLWDTRGLDEAASTHGIKAWIDKIRQLASQQASELRATIRSRIQLAIPILIWCIDAAKIDVEVQWHQFRKVYVEYCGSKAIPVVVITRGNDKAVDWEKECIDQLRKLELGVNVPLGRVRRYRGPTCPQHAEDSKALKALIKELVTKHPLTTTTEGGLAA